MRLQTDIADSDQPARMMRRLIWDFAGRLCNLVRNAAQPPPPPPPPPVPHHHSPRSFFLCVCNKCWEHFGFLQESKMHIQKKQNKTKKNKKKNKKKTRNIFKKDKRRKRYWNMNIEDLLLKKHFCEKKIQQARTRYDCYSNKWDNSQCSSWDFRAEGCWIGHFCACGQKNRALFFFEMVNYRYHYDL